MNTNLLHELERLMKQLEVLYVQMMLTQHIDQEAYAALYDAYEHTNKRFNKLSRTMNQENEAYE